MSDSSRPTSNINSSSRYLAAVGVPPGATDDKTRTSTAFLGGQQCKVEVGDPTDIFAKAFSDAAREVAASSGPVVQLQVPAGLEADDAGELQAIAAPAFEDSRAAETAILKRHIARLDLSESAKGFALNFLQQAIGMPANADYMQAIIETINRVDANAQGSGKAGAEVLHDMFIDNYIDGNTKTIVRAILDKASETRALQTDERYRALRKAIGTSRIAERAGSPNSIRNRNRAFEHALASLPDNLRIGLRRYFSP